MKRLFLFGNNLGESYNGERVHRRTLKFLFGGNIFMVMDTEFLEKLGLLREVSGSNKQDIVKAKVLAKWLYDHSKGDSEKIEMVQKLANESPFLKTNFNIRMLLYGISYDNLPDREEILIDWGIQV